MFDPFSELKSSYQAVRKNSAANDVYNRLHSIVKDIEFVRRVSKEWYDDQLLVIRDESALRCLVLQAVGERYVPSTPLPPRPNHLTGQSSASEYAYFKSTDGHMGQWEFSLRRANLHLIEFANKNGGFIIVDSTRRGKRMPDALSKTIPIWCAVINRAIAKRRSTHAANPSPQNQEQEWDSNLYCPPNIVSPTEKSQIEAKIDGWADQLLASSLTLPEPIAPLRPFFIHPAISHPPSLPLQQSRPAASASGASTPPPFLPIVCLSASTFIAHGGPETMRSRTGLGFEYIQGSGDDEDLWAQDFSGVVNQLKVSAGDTATPLNSAHLATLTEVPEASNLFLGVTNSSPLTGSLTIQLTRQTQQELADPPSASTNHLFFRIPKSKKGEIQFVTDVLPACVEAATKAFSSSAPRIAVVDDDGKDVSVGVMIALSWILLGNDGCIRQGPAPMD
ncbi:hypothetical protein QFC21_005305 [Naganishia friedmannii]|uniref:Uncharacterized protein n=1 Tax=Naganishia friedmannii TaxID=89922 RepID=A0ACC2VA39_9TREE|nr:hypothetical protein QFC21_005305 [Naganishia friedmannii]